MKLQARFMVSFSVGIAVVLLVSESVRQGYEGAQLARIETTYPERLEAATRENLAPMSTAVQRLREVMAEGDMGAFQDALNHQRGSDGILAATLFSADGTPAFTSEASKAEQHLPSAIRDRVASTGKATDRRLGDSVEMYQPFIAGTSCLQCHPDHKPGEMIGVLSVRMSNHSFLRVRDSWLAAMAEMRRGTLIVGVGVSVILVLALVLLVRTLLGVQLTKPLAAATEVVEIISRGDLTVEVDAGLRARQDEIGALATAMGSMVHRLRDFVRDVLAGVGATTKASGDLSGLAEGTSEAVGNVVARIGEASRAAATSSQDAVTAAAGIEEASTNLAAVSASTRDIRTQVGDTAALFEQARATTEAASSDAQSISSSMMGLTNAANDIGKVADVITGISEQTNLLALNATIEAARAGVTGKGFAVVATEIKQLAGETANATQDVKLKTSMVQTSTAAAIADLERIAQAIRTIAGTVSTTATALGDQMGRTNDVAERIAQASIGVGGANQSVARVAQAARSIAAEISAVNAAVATIGAGGEATRASAQTLSRVAQDLTTAARSFRLPA